ncbi:DUF1016 domain-containing protein [Dyadobacter flavalbus]|uniref:DUF1016 domain-containing protein n=1 Tax=Dyadobacter flavalbus TaxID=2579942 RepID=A0A5M8R419_9BACT|nr:PDDEXK nuclease domain-containing protein [Dyadobacter flavalbus]KAA6440892.1 DUF1016 domain-containing protein [Dyadobacter flavalbus]
MDNLKYDVDYRIWLGEIRLKIESSQIKVAVAVNSALISFYWELGKLIVEKQAETQWGDKLIDTLSKDLKEDFLDIKGLSSSNLKYCKRFYSFYSPPIGQQAVDQLQSQLFLQIPWGHNILIFTKSKNLQEANFYLQQTLENGWSRDILALQLKSNLYSRLGSSITNFSSTLPKPFSDLAQQTLKDPYIFDFLTLGPKAKELDIEIQLTQHVTQFLLELGKGFAFIGRQYHLVVGDSDYYIDLLFYHVKLKCYVVIELKNTKFTPEYTGKLNFYLSAVDSILKTEDDRPTIGMLLCRDKNNVEAEFALRDINKPMGISEFTITEMLPEDLRSNFPTVEEIENELRNLDSEVK